MGARFSYNIQQPSLSLGEIVFGFVFYGMNEDELSFAAFAGSQDLCLSPLQLRPLILFLIDELSYEDTICNR